MAHAFNPGTPEAEAGGSLSLRPAWSVRTSTKTGSKATEKPCLEKPKENISQKKKKKKKKKKNT